MADVKALFIAIIIASLKLAKGKNPEIFRSFTKKWRAGLNSLSVDELREKFRYIIALCSERLIALIFNRGVLSECWEFVKIAAETVIRRQTQDFLVLRPLMYEYEDHLGKYTC